MARDLRTTAIVGLLLMSAGIGSQLSGGNVNAFIIVGALLLWDQADRRPWVGAIIGVLTAIKLSPGIFIIWLISQRRWKALGWAVAGLTGGIAVGVVGAGWDAHLEAIDILRHSTPQNLTVTGLTGISWATMAVEVAGTILVLLLTRKPAASFRVAALTIVFGAPQVSLSTAVYGLLLLPPRRKTGDAAAPTQAQAVDEGTRVVDVAPAVAPEPAG